MKNDLSNQRFGKLQVLEATSERKHGYILWHCRCDCGKEVLLESAKLKQGVTKDCGCGTVVPANLAGQRFGKLVVKEKTTKRSPNRYILWRCQCDCGREIEVTRNKLLTGNVSSCGCAKIPARKNLVGKRFGNLEVIAYCKKENGSHMWECQCDCGRTTIVRQSNLEKGYSASCGCKHSPKENLHFIKGTCVERIQSKRISRANTSGIRGVYFNQHRKKWVAQIMFQGKSYYLGGYERLEDAAKARAKGEEMFDDFLAWYYQEYEKKNLQTGFKGGKNQCV